MRGMTTVPQDNQESLVVKDSVGNPRWAWGEQVRGMWYFPFRALTLLVWQQEGHLAWRCSLFVLKMPLNCKQINKITSLVFQRSLHARLGPTKVSRELLGIFGANFFLQSVCPCCQPT